MHLLPDVSKLTCQHQFHLRMNILHIRFNDKFPCHGLLMKPRQDRQQFSQFFRFQQTDAFQHGNVRHSAKYVILSQIQIQLTVFSHREFVDQGIIVISLVPEFCHIFAFYRRRKPSSSFTYKSIPFLISSISMYSSAVCDLAESPGPIFTVGNGESV